MGGGFSDLISEALSKDLSNLSPEKQKCLHEQYSVVREYFKKGSSNESDKSFISIKKEMIIFLQQTNDFDLLRVTTLPDDISTDDFKTHLIIRAIAYSRVLLIDYDPELCPLTKEQWLKKRSLLLEKEYHEYTEELSEIGQHTGAYRYKLENYITPEN